MREKAKKVTTARKADPKKTVKKVVKKVAVKSSDKKAKSKMQKNKGKVGKMSTNKKSLLKRK